MPGNCGGSGRTHPQSAEATVVGPRIHRLGPRRHGTWDERIVIVADDEDFAPVAARVGGRQRQKVTSEALCATMLTRLTCTVRTRSYGTVYRCSNRGRCAGTRVFSAVPPAGRAGVGAEERRRPTWRPRLPPFSRYPHLMAIKNSFAEFFTSIIFARVISSGRRSPYAAQHGAGARGWPPIVGRRLDSGRIRRTGGYRSEHAANRAALRPPERHQGQLLLALHRYWVRIAPRSSTPGAASTTNAAVRSRTCRALRRVNA